MSRIKYYNKETNQWEYADKAFGASSEIDLEPLIVTAISDTEVDKSVDEIHAAVESGREVFLSVDGGIVALTTIIESSIDEPGSAIFSANWGNFFRTWIVIGKSYYDLSFESANKEDIPTDEHINGLINTKLEGFDVPSGGGGEEWVLVASGTLEEDVTTITISTDKNGNPFSCNNMLFCMSAEGTQGKETVVYIPNGKWSGNYYGNANEALPTGWKRSFWLELYATDAMFYGREMTRNGAFFGQCVDVVDASMRKITSMKVATQNGQFKSGSKYALYKRGLIE